MKRFKWFIGIIEYLIFKLKCRKFGLREVPIYVGSKKVASIGLA